VSGAPDRGRQDLEEQVDAWCREEWMMRDGPKKPEAGPVSLEQVARGLAEGQIPWDAQVARQGTPSWRFATVVVFS
jgi:hypothetical protein